LIDEQPSIAFIFSPPHGLHIKGQFPTIYLSQQNDSITTSWRVLQMPEQPQMLGLTEELVREAIAPFAKVDALSPVSARTKCRSLIDAWITFLNPEGLLVPHSKKVTAPVIDQILKEFVPDSLSPTEAVRDTRIVYGALAKWFARYIYEWRVDMWPPSLAAQFDRAIVPAIMRAGIEEQLPFDEWIDSFSPKFLQLLQIAANDESTKQRTAQANPGLAILAMIFSDDGRSQRATYNSELQQQDTNKLVTSIRDYLAPIMAAVRQKPATRPTIDKLRDREYQLKLLLIDEEQVRNDQNRLPHERIALLQMLAKDRNAIEQQINELKQQLEFV
jgi:hypothetical protein